MREYFYTESNSFSYLNGQEIVNKEIPNEATLELYGQEVYEITFESGYSMIAYADEIYSEPELVGVISKQQYESLCGK